MCDCIIFVLRFCQLSAVDIRVPKREKLRSVLEKAKSEPFLSFLLGSVTIELYSATTVQYSTWNTWNVLRSVPLLVMKF